MIAGAGLSGYGESLRRLLLIRDRWEARLSSLSIDFYLLYASRSGGRRRAVDFSVCVAPAYIPSLSFQPSRSLFPHSSRILHKHSGSLFGAKNLARRERTDCGVSHLAPTVS